MRPSIPSVHSSKPICMRASKLPYICASCRHQALRQHSPQLQWMRNASSGLPFTERLRRKMWGTDNPPGMKDPYGGPSYFEQRRQEVQAEHEKGGDSEAAPITPERETPESALVSYKPVALGHGATSSARNWTAASRAVSRPGLRPLRKLVSQDPEKEDFEYVPAETWDGLEQVGLSGHWSEAEPIPEESFRPYVIPENKWLSPMC
jgi:hypothetical protein